MEYKGKTRNLRDIGRTLGVAHVVEASVQRVGDRVRINAQLIDARSDTHLWASDFDRELKDVFSVQAEIAEQIARAVRRKLSGPERDQIEKAPTTSLEAYDLYLRARQAWDEAGQTGDFREGQRVSFEALAKAIELDPKFTLAHALLARTHVWAYTSAIDASAQRLELAKRSAETALGLDPESPEAHAAIADYLHTGPRDYRGTMREYEHALRIAPSHSSAIEGLGDALLHLGRYEDALQHYRRSAELDPRNEAAVTGLASTLWQLRRYEEAARELERLATFAKRPFDIRVARAKLEIDWKGDTSALERVLATEKPARKDEACACYAWDLYLLKRDYGRAAEEILASPIPIQIGGGQRAPKEWFAAVALQSGGRHAEARQYFEVARKELAARLEEHPEFVMTRMAYAHALAGVGRRREALAEVERALADMPLSADAVQGMIVLRMALSVHVVVGETQRALDELQLLLRLPSGLSARRVELEPLLEPLRSESRYQALMRQHLG